MVLYQVSLHKEAVTLAKALSHFKKSIGTMNVHLTDALGEKTRSMIVSARQIMKEPA